MEVLNQTHALVSSAGSTMRQIQTGKLDRSMSISNGIVDMSGKAPTFSQKNHHQHHQQQRYSPYKLPSVDMANDHGNMMTTTTTSTSSTTTLFNDQESSINSSACNEVIELQHIPQQSPILLQSTPPQTIGNGGGSVIKQLNDFKVQELKHECKIRNLPVSGAKPQLIERLRPYHKEIIDARMQFDIYPQTPSNGSEDIYVSSSSSPKSNNLNQSSTSVINNYLQKTVDTQQQQQKMQKSMTTTTTQVVQLVDGSGKVLGLARVQYPPQKQHDSPLNLSPPQPLTPSQQTSSYNSSQQFIQKTDNIYRFSQLGSGGQFTLVNNQTDYTQEEPIYEAQQQQHQQQQQQQQTQHILNDSRTMSSYVPSVKEDYGIPSYRQEPQHQPQQQQSTFEECRMIVQHQPCQQQQPPQQMQMHKNSMSLQDSPCAGDQAGKSPNMPVSEHMSSYTNCGSNNNGSSSCQEILTEETRTSTTPPQQQQQQQQQQQPSTSSMVFDTQKLLSPKTLQIHEEMLREQQKQINEIMSLLGKNQKILKEQQELILTAKKQQQKYKQTLNKQSVMEQKNVKPSNDYRQFNRQHIQQFLAHKAQQQQIAEHTEEHNRLHKTETRLVEELHVGTAVEDIVRLIKQDARTALLIVSLLHKYRVERDQQHLSQPNGTKKDTQKDLNQQQSAPPATKKKQSVHSLSTVRKAQKRASTTPQPTLISPPQPQKERENVDMEEIFKSVIEDASRSTSKSTSLIHQPPLPQAIAAPQQRSQIVPMVIDTIQIDDQSPEMPQQQQLGEKVPIQPQYDMQCDYDFGNIQQLPQPQPNQHQVMVNGNHNMFEPEGFPNIDEMVANMNENDDLKMNLDSDELATILGDDWINQASRNINNNGQYDPQTPNGSANHQDHIYGEQQNMDWLDQMIQNGSYE